jgi:hypothetical protein
MPAIDLLLNLLWIMFGGLWMAIAWLVAVLGHVVFCPGPRDHASKPRSYCGTSHP